jgi:hypothetical protein
VIDGGIEMSNTTLVLLVVLAVLAVLYVARRRGRLNKED